MEERIYTVAEILEDYRADFLMRGCKSVRSLRSEIKILNDQFGMMPVAEVTVRTLRGYQASVVAGGSRPATVNKLMAVLKASFHLAAMNEIIPAVPPFPRRLTPGPPRQGFLENDDYQAIRRELPEWGAPVLDFGYWSGWRKGEVLGLRRDEIDLEAQRVTLRADRSKNRHARTIPLRDFGLEAIETAISRPTETGLVFTRGGKRISGTRWHDTWATARARAGRPRLLFHDLRRTVVRRLELAGVRRKTAMAWVGHRTEAIYLRYSISIESDLLPAADRMLRSMRTETEATKVVSIFSRRL